MKTLYGFMSISLGLLMGCANNNLPSACNDYLENYAEGKQQFEANRVSLLKWKSERQGAFYEKSLENLRLELKERKITDSETSAYCQEQNQKVMKTVSELKDYLPQECRQFIQLVKKIEPLVDPYDSDSYSYTGEQLELLFQQILKEDDQNGRSSEPFILELCTKEIPKAELKLKQAQSLSTN